MTTVLVTDSTAYLPHDLCRDGGIEVVPLHVMVGPAEHAEGVDITPAEVAAALRGPAPVTTSRPSPAAFLDAYTRAAAGGASEIVSVHLSSGLSSTLTGAQLAARQSPVPVTVVDSQSLGMAMGYAVLAGTRLARQGAGAGEVADLVRRSLSRATVAFYVDTLEFLRRGGRIGRASAFLGSALAIKPILALDGGLISPIEKVRTSSRAIARLEELAVEAATAATEGVRVAVHHLDSAERAVLLAERLTTRLGDALLEMRVVELGAVVGAHVGPGTLAVAVVPHVGPLP